MATSIQVGKQSVLQLLSGGKEHRFVIPEYQRPYSWECDEIKTLFDDLWEFTSNEEKCTDGKVGTYFLGSVVSFKNDKSEQEIIDGQQRITSLFLLLRAIYTYLQSTDAKTKEANNFITKIEPAIWITDDLTGEPQYSKILLESRVINNDGNEVLQCILEKGVADENAKDNYSRNYIKFQKLFAEAAKRNSLMIYSFIKVILNQAVLLPITTDSQDTALTIFSTLNDRGRPLSDADIFKAKIYNWLNDAEKKGFIENWKKLDEDSTSASESIQQLFYYYMFYLRALEGDKNTTTPGVRKFFTDNKSIRLRDNNLIPNLKSILRIWEVVNTGLELDEETWPQNRRIRQSLDILKSYPNEYWKYPVIIYYLLHRENPEFESCFDMFLRKLIVELLELFLLKPTVSAVKGDILKLNIAISKSITPQFEFQEINKELLSDSFKVPHTKVVRMLLKILAYSDSNQTELLSEGWEIEHIFPQTWQPNYCLQESDASVKEKIEHLGNKIPFEKRLNIKASNGYFARKKKEYASSKIAITKAMSTSHLDDWRLENIVERDVRVSDTLFKVLGKWSDDYDQYVLDVSGPTPFVSPDQAAMIEALRLAGFEVHRSEQSINISLRDNTELVEGNERFE